MAALDQNQTSGTALPIAEEVRRLRLALGATSVSATAGTRDVRRVHDWARHDGHDPSTAERDRILVARRVWRAIVDAEGEQAARLWFVAANPCLADLTPIDAIREGRFHEVLIAVTAAIEVTPC